MGVVNVRLKIKAQRVKFITRLLSGDGDGLWKSLAEHFIGKYKYYNINTDILKCKIINRKVHFKTMPSIYREMLKAWSDVARRVFSKFCTSIFTIMKIYR